MDSDFCLICGEAGTEKLTVVKNGLGTLRHSSKLREDGIEQEIKGKETVHVHAECRKKYTNPRYIELDRKRREDAQKKPPSSSSRSSGVKFNFKSKCTICGKSVPTAEQRLKHPNRDPVSVVTTLIMHDSIRNAAACRSDSWGEEVLLRIENSIDLVAAEARYHRNCYSVFRNPRSQRVGGASAGRLADQNKSEGFAKLCRYMENEEYCVFSLSELEKKLKQLSPLTKPYSSVHLLKKLEEKYKGLDVVRQPGQSTLVTLKGAGKLLTKEWYTQRRAASITDERLRVVETAAKIVLEDIKGEVYDTARYPTPAEVACGGQENVPTTLQHFIETLVCAGKRGEPESLRRKCLALAHGLIQAARPRSFISPIQFGLGLMLHKNYGSRQLIDILNSLGFCSSFAEISNYEAVVALTVKVNIDSSAFVQFVFDNVDITVRTLDGHNTVHAMGGVVCVTPGSSVTVNEKIPRRTDILPSQGNFRKVAEIPVMFRGQVPLPGLTSVKVKIPENFPGVDEFLLPALLLDTLWLAASYLSEDTPFPGWNGYMAASTTRVEEFQVSAVIPTPLVNLQPSNPTTIFTCLKYAEQKSKEIGKNYCLVTFDQPLFFKAMKIVLEEPSLSTVTVRLGGFHILMSYLGAVGFIMAGSGLEHLWETVYAKNTVHHMMSGHAFSRSLRAHFLTQQALVHCLLDMLPAGSIPKAQVRRVASQLLQGEIAPAEAVSDPCVQEARTALESVMNFASETRTGKFWIRYIKFVQVMRNFVRAERSGLWHLHLHAIQEMLPIFFSSGHLHYAKSSLLYLQSMETLEQKMDALDFDKFARAGYFTVRRSPKFWGGVWTDMTIEQTLMRTLKARGGLTQGRGTGPGSIAKYLQTAPATMPVIDAVENFCGVRSESGEQHKELRDSRKRRDRVDLEKFLAWLSSHSPFEARSDNLLISLSTGAVGDAGVNCDQALEVGNAAVEKSLGTPYSELHVRRSDRVKTLAGMTLTLRSKTKGDVVLCNPNALFHRLICVLEKKQTLDVLPRCFAYEMSARPPALFDDAFMRQGTKSTLVEKLQKYAPPSSQVPANPAHTIDGGFLLHKIPWPSPATYAQVCQTYVGYVLSFPDSCVVFDGYRTPSTKDEAHLRRRTTVTSTDLEIRNEIFVSVSRDRFLSNETNKTKFIELLSQHLEAAGVRVYQADGDADTLIVRSAISRAAEGRNSVLVGEDTDLLVLLIALSPKEVQTFMLMPGRSGAQHRVFNINKLQISLGELLVALLLFFHAFTGCDTTSAPYMRGKLKSWEKLVKCAEELKQALKKFNDPQTSREEISRIGERFMLELYSAPNEESLDHLRFISYQRVVAKKSPGSEFQLSSLPPTSAATRQHSFRTFYQVQDWLGSTRLNVTEWGWALQGNRLRPVTTSKAPAPDELLDVFFCNCPNECGEGCDCVAGGVPCSPMCGFCGGTACDNMPQDQESDDDDDPDEPRTLEDLC